MIIHGGDFVSVCAHVINASNTHTLSQYTLDGGGAYITSGAGSLVETADQLHEPTKAKAEGLCVEDSHSFKTVFNQKVAGFTLHTFNSDYTELTNEFIGYDGEVVHSFTVTKGQSYTPSEEK